MSDISIDLISLNQLQAKVQNIIIVENEINFLALPKIKNTWAILGAGYHCHILAKIDWLKNCQLFYWGDIDTHGFAILNQLRESLPQVQSILMTEQILLTHRHFWSKEDKPFNGELERLTLLEQSLYQALREQKWGENIRLEQEFIGFSMVEEVVCLYFNKNEYKTI